MKIGAHVSTSGGIENAVDRGIEIGCETSQIFGASPQSWSFKTVPVENLVAFKSRAKEAGIRPIFLHCIYSSANFNALSSSWRFCIFR